MTDQTKAPERICVEFNNNGTASVISPVPKILGTMEYIRKDIAAEPATIVPAILANVARHLGAAGYHDAEEYVLSEFIADRAMNAAVFSQETHQ